MLGEVDVDTKGREPFSHKLDVRRVETGMAEEAFNTRRCAKNGLLELNGKTTHALKITSHSRQIDVRSREGGARQSCR